MKIGRDYIGTSAGSVITNNEGKFFLAKRGSGARDDVGKWEFPGGSIHLFESRQNAAIRNVSEKYGMKIKIQELLGVYDVIDDQVGDHWISTTFLCKYIGGEPKIVFLEKCSDLGWFAIDEVLKMDVSRITKLNLKDVLR